MPKKLPDKVSVAVEIDPEALISDMTRLEILALLDAILNNPNISVKEVRSYVNSAGYDDPGKPELE